MVIGLTGGMASGKTTALQLFAKLGCKTIDCDVLAKELLKNDKELQAAVRERFGPDYLLPDGSVNATKLAHIVFTNKEALEWLEAQMHPKILSAWQIQVKSQPKAIWVVEISLLFEKKLEKYCDYTICLQTSLEKQREQALKRGFSLSALAARTAHQYASEDKAKRASCVLFNSGTLDALEAQIRSFLDSICPENS